MIKNIFYLTLKFENVVFTDLLFQVLVFFYNFQTVHGGEGSKPCEVCAKVMREDTMGIHMKSMHPDFDKYKCKHCPEDFWTVRSMDYHVWVKHAKKDIPCHLCPMKFKINRLLRNHLLNKHGVETPDDNP